ncbi:MAG: CBS domain-containing protein [Candidatus Dadabacteria bacterium]|nr:MAG: CBS domain-containing protein [Candidatus Dadabacteria bacterium]
MTRSEIKVPTLKSVMTPFPYAVEAENTLSEAVEIMRSHNIHHLPVISDETVVGILTEQDVKWALDPLAPSDSGRDLQVKDVCRKEIFKAEIDQPLQAVLREMVKLRNDCVLVMKNHRVVGVFTTTDACSALADIIEKIEETPEDSVA